MWGHCITTQGRLFRLSGKLKYRYTCTEVNSHRITPFIPIHRLFMELKLRFQKINQWIWINGVILRDLACYMKFSSRLTHYTDIKVLWPHIQYIYSATELHFPQWNHGESNILSLVEKIQYPLYKVLQYNVIFRLVYV